MSRFVGTQNHQTKKKKKEKPKAIPCSAYCKRNEKRGGMNEDSCNRKSLDVILASAAARYFFIEHRDLKKDQETALPRLLVVCRESSSLEANPIVVDGLGLTGTLSAKGYFRGSGEAFSGGSIHLLYDRFNDDKELEATVRHELVHAMDHSAHGLDMMTCAGLACSEVRAAAAGECDGLGPLFKGRCVMQNATNSTSMVFPSEGRHCVRTIFAQCSSLSPTASPSPYIKGLLGKMQ